MIDLFISQKQMNHNLQNIRTHGKKNKKFYPWEQKSEWCSQPVDYRERNVKGHFRIGDQRWTQDQLKIINYVFDPHQPVLYKINQKLKPNEHVAYTRQQLQVVREDEEDVPVSILGNQNQEEFVIKKLLGKRQRGNRTEYLVQWKGYPVADATWEFKSKIPKSFIDVYEEENA